MTNTCSGLVVNERCGAQTSRRIMVIFHSARATYKTYGRCKNLINDNCHATIRLDNIPPHVRGNGVYWNLVSDKHRQVIVKIDI